MRASGQTYTYDFGRVWPRVCFPFFFRQVVTPTLILLGRKDRRVPALVGEEFYHLLRAQGTVTRFVV